MSPPSGNQVDGLPPVEHKALQSLLYEVFLSESKYVQSLLYEVILSESKDVQLSVSRQPGYRHGNS